MKQIVFKRNQLEQLVATVIENKGLDANGNVIAVKKSLLKELDAKYLEEKKISKVVCKRVIFYTFDGKFTLVVFRKNKVYDKLTEYQKETNERLNMGKDEDLLKAIITDEKIGGVLLGTAFQRAGRSIYMNISGNREIPKVYVNKILREEKTMETEITEKQTITENGKIIEKTIEKIESKTEIKDTIKSSSLALPKVLWLIKSNKMKRWSVLKEDILGLEAHHIKAGWDNRSINTKVVTPKEHRQLHNKKNGGQRGHYMAVKITNTEELEAFVELMCTNYPI